MYIEAGKSTNINKGPHQSRTHTSPTDTFHHLTWEAVYSRSNRALVSKVPRNPTLVLGSCSTNEAGMKNQAILWCVPPRFQCPIHKNNTNRTMWFTIRMHCL